MLTEIHCDGFAPQNRTMRFHDGLNTILGSSNGSNAIGKTTALWLIDFAFGGEKYHSLWKDSIDNIGRDPVFFSFRFTDEDFYFFRTFEEPKTVVRCDVNGNAIDRKNLEWFRGWLAQQYETTALSIPFIDIQSRFFRIYGADNTFEQMPFVARLRESNERALEFLIRLSGNGMLLDSLQGLYERSGLTGAQALGKTSKPVDLAIIARNESTIAALQARLSDIMEKEDQEQLAFLGFTTGEFDKLQDLQKRVQQLVRIRNRKVAQRDAISTVRPHVSVNIAEEFESLQEFFPGIERRPFEQIESFHLRLRGILKSESEQEVDRINVTISELDAEINQLKVQMQQSGVPRELTAGKIQQCVSITIKIQELQQENEALLRQKELQDAREQAEQELRQLIAQRDQCIGQLIARINTAIASLNSIVTNDAETAPLFSITPAHELSFATVGNISEGTAFKSLVLYDLAIAKLFHVPAIVHDSNILKRIEDTQFERILQCYQDLGKQVFIAFDKAESATPAARVMLDTSAVLRLSDGNVLFGKAWNRK